MRVPSIKRTDMAIVGMACRFPGGCDTPEAYWKLLAEGRNAVTEIPDDRWEKDTVLHPSKRVPGRSYTYAAGVLDDIKGFDAAFFGISRREADAMDPQQRLLLEMAWEALESGGQVPSRLEGSNCAVYVGISSTEYGSIQQGDPESTNAYMMLGATLSIAANRLSYQFDLHGPSMSIDTACSSAMVALNEALNALWAGRCDMALVGGISLLLSPFPFIGFAKATMLSDYGLCRAFGAEPGGYVRGEGGGLIAIKPLADAIRDGDPIHAVISGSGANADGRTKGIALPSHTTQRALIEETMAKFDIDPAEIDFFEAHGTGTSVGDPAESQAIGEAIGQHRKAGAGPLPVGSAKSNIGHLEPASGMAGLIKTVLAIQHRAVPATLHASELNPNIDFRGLNIAPVQTLTPLQKKERPIVAGLNSFGFGGANATVFLREHIGAEVPLAAQVPPTPPLFLTAKSPAALRDMAGKWASFLKDMSERDYYDAAHTAAYRREKLPYRLMARGSGAAAIRTELEVYAAGGDNVVTGEAKTREARTGFVFSGNGAQWAGMGRELYAESGLFRATVDRIDAEIAGINGQSIVSALMADDAEEKFHRTDIAQPALLAVQIGIVECLKEAGLTPDAVAGHSVGEVAAAYVAGAIDLSQAARLIVARSQAQEMTRGKGRMAAAGISPERAFRIEEASGGKIELAAVNAANSVTLTGDAAALADLGKELEAERVFFRQLDLDYAFHSKILEPVEDEFRRQLGTVESCRPDTPFYSTARGCKAESFLLDADYWWENARNPVMFRDAVGAMVKEGVELLIEIGPHPVLTSYLRQILRDGKSDFTPLASMSRGEPGASVIERTVDAALCKGAPVDLSASFPVSARSVELPRYAWQREQHWFKASREAEGWTYRSTEGPLIGARPQEEHATWESQIDTERYRFLADHVVGNAIVLPASAYAELALEASSVLFGEEACDIEMLEIRRPIVLTRNQIMNVRFVYDEEDKAFRIETRRRTTDDRWSLNAVGRISIPMPGGSRLPVAVKPSERATIIGHEEHYKIAEALGLDYGPAFQLVDTVHADGDVAVTTLHTPATVLQGMDRFMLHPSFLDGCLQSLFSLLYAKGERNATAYLPYQINRLKLHRPRNAVASCRTLLRKRKEKSLVADFHLFDVEGNCIAEATGVRFMLAEFQSAGETGKRFGFETVPLDHAEASDATPCAEEIAAVLDLEKGIAVADTATAPQLDRIASSLLLEAYHRSGSKTTDKPAARSLFERALQIAGSSETTTDGAVLWREAFAKHPAYLAELNAILCQTKTYSERQSLGEATLSESTADHLLSSSPSYGTARQKLLSAVEAFVNQWPDTRRLRILEIGCANGLVRDILGARSKRSIDFTVVSSDGARMSALERDIDSADARFIEADLASILSEGDLAKIGAFDLIIAPMVSVECGLTAALHRNIEALLVPCGVVIASNPLPSFWADAVFGTRDTWWRTDGGTPLATADALGELFNSAGYRNIVTIAVGGAAILIADGKHTRRKMTATVSESHLPDAEDTGWLVAYDPSLPGAYGAEKLCETLEAQGALVIRIHARGDEKTADALPLDPDDEAQWLEAYETVKDAGIKLKGVILFGNICSDPRPGWGALLATRALSRIEFETAPQLTIVTANAASFEPNLHANLLQAPLWGIRRVIANELPRIDSRAIDLQGEDLTSEKIVSGLAHVLLGNGAEAETIIRADGTFAPRLRPVPTEDEHDGPSMKRLGFVTGRLGSLGWKTRPMPEPGPSEIVVTPKATGLNFRDVMFALGALPAEALEDGFAGACLGMEAAGIVAAAGTESGFKKGDKVLFFAPNCFDSHVVVKAASAVHKPANLSFEEAATIPTAFFTAQYALDYLARLRRGERLLIHGAAGGVGLAALQVAREAGADILVTVGSPEKRALMTALGIPEERIFDSRSLLFADDILEATNREGVDVILNSLAGDAIHRNLAILRPFGRFLELGKRDFYENSRIGLKFFRNNLSYFGIDADQLMEEKPELAREIFANLVTRFSEGIYTPLPYRSFEASRISDAFRLMQKSGHIGKILIKPPTTDDLQERERHDGISVDPNASYLVTGGLSGFGYATAQWLVGEGARHLVLANRSGAANDEARRLVSALEAQGASVDAAPCDVTDERAVEALFVKAEAKGLPIRGVIHAAAVFDDATIDWMEERKYRRVSAPKVQGAAVLHKVTAGRALDFFVLYSSVGTAFGNPGQANYVAANVFLETLAQYRRAAGLPALTIGWGAISDTGFLARNEKLKEQLSARMGTSLLTAEDAMHELGDMIARNQTNLYAGEINWQRLRAGLPILQQPVYREVAPGAARSGTPANDEDILEKLGTMSIEEGTGYVAQILAEEIGQVLRLAADKIDTAKSIFDLGMDSLMALELKLGIEDRFGVEIPVMSLSEGTSLNTLAHQIVMQIRGEEAASDDLAQNLDTIISRHVNDSDIENARFGEPADEKPKIATQFGT